MKKIIESISIFVLCAVFITSCNNSTPLDRLYADGSSVAEQPAKWASTLPILNSSPDSASYLMGYIYGARLNIMMAKKRLPELENIDRQDFEKGIAMALAADSTQLGTLYGIMLGLELRGNMNSVSKDIDLKWNMPLTYKGFYQGMNGSIPGALPVPLVEEQLNRLLQPYFMTSGN